MYKQVNSVAMRPPLESILAEIFMVECERILIPTLKLYFLNWHRFVDNTFYFINCQSADYVLSVLNNFHRHIQFTFE